MTKVNSPTGQWADLVAAYSATPNSEPPASIQQNMGGSQLTQPRALRRVQNYLSLQGVAHTHILGTPPPQVQPEHIAQLHAAISDHNMAAINRLTSALRRNNETIPATVSAALFEHATDADTDLPIKRALLSLPGVRPLHVFNVAVTKNDTELAEHLLRKGAKVDRLTGDVRRQAGPEMQKLLHTAEAISKLYPPQRGNARLMPKSRMQKALESFNLPEARRLLAEEKKERNLTDVKLWQSTTRPYIRSAILVLGDEATLKKLMETQPGGGTIMHDGMRKYKATSPALYRYLTSFPYRSEKHDHPALLNGAAYFEGTNDPITCRHLSTKWLLERIGNNNKFKYAKFADADAIRANVKADIGEKYLTLVSYASENHLRKNSEWGQFAVEQFRALALNPRKENESERAIHMFVNPMDHSMAAELKMKFSTEGTTTYVVNFFDPNSTNGGKRVAFDALEVDDLQDLAKLDLAALLPSEEFVPLYYAAAHGEPVTMMHIISSNVLDDNTVAGMEPAKRLTSRSDILTPSVLFYLLNRGYSEDLQALKPEIAAHLNTLERSQRTEFLAMKSEAGDPAAFNACQHGHTEMVEKFCELVRGEADEIELLSAQNAEGVPALHIALCKRHSRTVEAVCKAVLSSSLDSGYKVALLLAAKREGGVPGIHLTLQNNHLTTIGGYYRTVLESGLLPGEKFHVLSGRRADGLSTMAAAVLLDSPGAITIMANELKRSNLPKLDQLKLFASMWEEDTDPNSVSEDTLDLLFAQPKNPATIEAYRTAATELGVIEEPVIQRILSAWNNALAATGNGSRAPEE